MKLQIDWGLPGIHIMQATKFIGVGSETDSTLESLEGNKDIWQDNCYI